MGLNVIVRRELIYSVLPFRETHMTTVLSFFLMRICALTLDI